MKTEPNEPANPFFTWNIASYEDCVVLEGKDGKRQYLRYKPGLTKREHFAAMAMQGLLSGAHFQAPLDELCQQSVEVADALIKELNKGNEDK